MTETYEDVEVYGMESKFTKVALTIVAVLLIFIGPTYMPYLLSKVVGVDYYASIGVGAALFIVGLMMLIYLIRKKVIT